MEPVVAVQTLLLRAQLPELPLRPGASIVARVLSRGDTHGVLVIAGIPLTAQMPREVGATGETLRLSVQEVTPERVTLALVHDQAPVPQEPRRPRVTVQEAPHRTTVAGEERHTVALSFDSPAGRLDLRLELGAKIHATVGTPAGAVYERANAAAGRLHDGLQARTGLEPEVRIVPRREPLDVLA